MPVCRQAISHGHFPVFWLPHAPRISLSATCSTLRLAFTPSSPAVDHRLNTAPSVSRSHPSRLLHSPHVFPPPSRLVFQALLSPSLEPSSPSAEHHQPGIPHRRATNQILATARGSADSFRFSSLLCREEERTREARDQISHGVRHARAHARSGAMGCSAVYSAAGSRGSRRACESAFALRKFWRL